MWEGKGLWVGGEREGGLWVGKKISKEKQKKYMWEGERVVGGGKGGRLVGG